MPSGNKDLTLPRFTPLTDPRPEDTAWPQPDWPPEPGVRLIGSAVTLTGFEPERDVEELFEAVNHDAVWTHVAGRPAHARDFGERLQVRQSLGNFIWVVRLTRPLAGLSTGAVVGTTSYLEVSTPDARLEIGSTLYCPAVWGSAVNPDAKLQLLRYAFETLGMGRVQLKTDIRNARSQQAIARLGARYEGVLRRYQRRADGTVRDTVLFSLLAEEWPPARTGLLHRLSI